MLLNHTTVPGIIREERVTSSQRGHAVKNLLLSSSSRSYSQHVRYHFSATFAALCWMSVWQLVFELHSVKEEMFIRVAPNRK